jgi:uncharacterized peroxidase-related enzyme
MSFLKSLPAETRLLEIFQAFPSAARPLLEYLEVVLRGESPFSAAERELLAAYVSSLNKCNYCEATHSQTAIALGIKGETVADIFSGSGRKHVDVRMRPVLAFVHKLTLSPNKITAADVDPILAEGWNDRALHDAAAVCGLFNLINRLACGLGLEASEESAKLTAQRLAQGGYAQLLNALPPAA